MIMLRLHTVVITFFTLLIGANPICADSGIPCKFDQNPDNESKELCAFALYAYASSGVALAGAITTLAFNVSQHKRQTEPWKIKIKEAEERIETLKEQIDSYSTSKKAKELEKIEINTANKLAVEDRINQLKTIDEAITRATNEITKLKQQRDDEYALKEKYSDLVTVSLKKILLGTGDVVNRAAKMFSVATGQPNSMVPVFDISNMPIGEGVETAAIAAGIPTDNARQLGDIAETASELITAKQPTDVSNLASQVMANGIEMGRTAANATENNTLTENMSKAVKEFNSESVAKTLGTLFAVLNPDPTLSALSAKIVTTAKRMTPDNVLDYGAEELAEQMSSKKLVDFAALASGINAISKRGVVKELNELSKELKSQATSNDAEEKIEDKIADINAALRYPNEMTTNGTTLLAKAILKVDLNSTQNNLLKRYAQVLESKENSEAKAKWAQEFAKALSSQSIEAITEKMEIKKEDPLLSFERFITDTASAQSTISRDQQQQKPGAGLEQPHAIGGEKTEQIEPKE